MPKHAAPSPALFSRPGTYLLAAFLVTGAMVGAVPLSPIGTTLLALGTGIPLALLAVLPAPGERRRPTTRRVAQPHIPAAVYAANAMTLFRVLFSGIRPLEPEAVASSHPLESEAGGYRTMAKCWCGCGGGFLVAVADGSAAGGNGRLPERSSVV